MKSNFLQEYNGKALIFTNEEEQVNNEIYATLNTVIEINADMFHNMGTQNKPVFYPKKELSNQIGAGMGIEFMPNMVMEEVFGDEVIDESGNRIRKVAGIRCIKQGKRRRPDGTWQLSSPCSYVFNWQDRAELDFLADEEKWGQTWNDGNTKCRYYFGEDRDRTRRERRKHILDLKKFADQRASTGAELMVIRELTGMPTAFKADDLAKQRMVVSQVCESKAYQKVKARAHVDNIRMGGHIAQDINEAAGLLTGGSTKVQENVTPQQKRQPDPPAETKQENPPTESTGNPLLDEFNELLKDENVLSKPGMKEHYEKLLRDNGDSDDFLTWAIGDIKMVIGGTA